MSVATHRQVGRYLVVGSCNVLVDLGTYVLCLWAGMSVNPSKAGAFVAGTVFAYFANRTWTFNVQGSPRSFVALMGLYTLTLWVNVGTNSLVVNYLGRDTTALATAYVVATGLTATLNFLGMKYLVFRPTRALNDS